MHPSPQPFRVPPWLRRAALAAVLASFLALGLSEANLRDDPEEMDTTRYLNAAHFVREGGGLLALPWLCLSGAYREAVQQPLYHAALAVVAEREFAFFNRAKLLTVLIGAFAVFAAYWAARRQFGDAPGLAAALLMGWSAAFVHHASMVACEAMLMAWVALAWGAAGNDADGDAASAVALGLAFLTKASALLMAPLFAAYVWLCAPKGGRWRRAGTWVLLFAATISPLLVRNARVFGNPLYNPHSRIMWLDRWEDSYRPEFQTEPPSAWSYLSSRSVGEIWGRMAEGLAGVGRTLAFDVATLAIPPGPWRDASGPAVLALALGGLALDKRRMRAGFSLAVVLAFVAAFGWYWRVAAGSRFLLPFAPMLFAYAGLCAAAGAAALIRLAVGKKANAGAGTAGFVCVAALAGLVGVMLARPSLWANPMAVGRVAPGHDELREWLSENLEPCEPYAHGPSRLYGYSWNTRPPLRAVPLPLVEDMASLQAWLAERGIRYMVLDFETAHRRRDALRGYIVPPERRGAPVRVVRLPEGWGVAALGAGGAVVVVRVGGV